MTMFSDTKFLERRLNFQTRLRRITNQCVPRSAVRRARTLVLTASKSLAGAGRWVPPKKLPPLTAEVEDIDWWFHQMRIHLDNCQIFDPARRLHCMHTYTDDAFHARIRVRAQAEGVDKNRLLTNVDVYRVFVADRFTKDTAVEKLRDQLKDLAAKSLPPTKAWDTVRKYSFCFNEKAKRNATEELTHEQISYYFANALHPTLAQHMRSLLLHNHPMKFDSSHALTAAQQYVDQDEVAKDKRVIKKQKNDDSDVEKTEQSAMLATKHRNGRRRPKRQRDEQVSGATKDLDKKRKPSDSKNNDKSRDRDSIQSENLALPAVGQQQNRPNSRANNNSSRSSANSQQQQQQQQQQSQQWRPQSQQQNQALQQQLPFRPRQPWNDPTSFSSSSSTPSISASGTPIPTMPLLWANMDIRQRNAGCSFLISGRGSCNRGSSDLHVVEPNWSLPSSRLFEQSGNATVVSVVSSSRPSQPTSTGFSSFLGSSNTTADNLACDSHGQYSVLSHGSFYDGGPLFRIHSHSVSYPMHMPSMPPGRA